MEPVNTVADCFSKTSLFHFVRPRGLAHSPRDTACDVTHPLFSRNDCARSTVYFRKKKNFHPKYSLKKLNKRYILKFNSRGLSNSLNVKTLKAKSSNRPTLIVRWSKNYQKRCWRTLLLLRQQEPREEGNRKIRKKRKGRTAASKLKWPITMTSSSWQ